MALPSDSEGAAVAGGLARKAGRSDGADVESTAWGGAAMNTGARFVLFVLIFDTHHLTFRHLSSPDRRIVLVKEDLRTSQGSQQRRQGGLGG